MKEAKRKTDKGYNTGDYITLSRLLNQEYSLIEG